MEVPLNSKKQRKTIYFDKSFLLKRRLFKTQLTEKIASL